MARIIPIARSYSRAMAARFKNTVYGYLTGFADTISPVQRLGHVEFSDTERPAFHIYSYQAPVAAEYPSSSITSASDLAIEAISWQAFANLGAPEAGTIILFMPIVGYIPWIGAGVPTYYVPGIKPRIEFDAGSTVAVCGTNPFVTPIAGWWAMSTLSVGNNANNNVLYFDPPLILPATMILSVQYQSARKQLVVCYRYREID